MYKQPDRLQKYHNDISTREIAKGAEARGTTHDISIGETTEGAKLGS